MSPSAVRRTARFACGVLLALALVACSSSSDRSSSGSGGTTPAAPTGSDSAAGGHASSQATDPGGKPPTATTAPSAVPAFDGDDFYQVPDPLPKGDPGAIIRTQQISDSGGRTTVRVMYHSVDASGKDRAVTGLITYPDAGAPAEGWPVVSWDHGTSGLSQTCAPSRGSSEAPAFGVNGVAVATDYLGMGPDGELHPYLNRTTEARATIDIVRAAQNLEAAHAGTRWVVVGHSQGGHASLATGEVAPGYAPELDLIGTVAVAPGAELGAKIPGEATLVPDIVTVLGLYGHQAEDPSFDPKDYLSKPAQGVEPLIKTACLDKIQDYLVNVATKGPILDPNPRDTPAGKAWLAHNEVGAVKTPSPILVVQGTADPIVVPARTKLLLQHLCSVGDTAQLIELPGADHGTELGQGAKQISDWINARFAGEKPTSTC